MTTKSYETLLADCKKITSQKNHYDVDAIIDNARVNADDTIRDGDAPESDWGYLFTATIGSQLSTGEYDRHVVGFFTKRGITY
jgi:hypothetical protein